MFSKIKPPTTGFTEVVLYRGAYTDYVEIYLGENTYALAVEDARRWFKAICPENFFLERVFGYLWNMRCLKYFVDSKSFIPFEIKQSSRIPVIT